MPPAANIVRMKWAVVEDVKKALPAGPFTFHLAEYIAAMEIACRKNPQSAELLACLGIALALNHDTQKSVEYLERATQLDPHHFFARLKLAGLFYSLFALPPAEAETLKALALAANHSEASLARQQLAAIRKSMQQENRPGHPAALSFSLLWT